MDDTADALREWLNLHERHGLFYGRENGGVDIIRCSSCEDFGGGQNDETRFYMSRTAAQALDDADAMNAGNFV